MSALASQALTSRLGERNARVVIIHNHPIHYKELLFRALAERQLQFTVLFTAATSIERRDPDCVPRPYDHRFGSDGPYETASPWRTMRYVWSALNELQPATVIVSGYYDIAAWTAWLWAVKFGRVRILWAESNHFDYRRRWWKELPKKLFIRFCHMAHVYGTSNQEYLEALGMARDRIHIKRAVLDVEQFSPDPDQTERTGPLRLIFVGRLENMKNLPRLIKCFCSIRQDLSRPWITLTIVGYGRLESELKELAGSLPMGRLVDFRGGLPNAETVREYQRSDVFILPSTREAWGLVALEAMCCGLPVLISERCGCARDLVNDETGWSFDPFDDDGLTALLERVSHMSRADLQRLGKASREIGATYSAQNCAAVIQRTIEEARL